jgi:hypothetical protein
MIKVLIDENLSEQFAEGLHIIQEPLGDGITVTSIAKEFHRGAKDEEWIPLWGEQKGVFITQDIKITTRRQQAQLLTDYKLGAFFVDVPKNYLYWDRVRIIIDRWQEIVTIIKKTKRPFAYLITPRKIERMELK